MANFVPSQKTAQDFNNGVEYIDGVGDIEGDAVHAESINNVIEGLLYTQGLGINSPDVSEANQVGTVTVSIITYSDGTARLKFSNLKGEQGVGISTIVENGTDSNGGNIYKITLDDGRTYNFVAPKGKKGDTGNGIADTIITYATSASGITPPINGWQSEIPIVTKGDYLWTRTIDTYTNGTSKTSYSVAYQGKDGTNVDPALSTTSENPVQNKVITNALNNKMDNASAATSFNSLNLGINTLRTSVVISTCSTAADVANKIVLLPVNSNLSVVDGLVLRVKFTNANTAYVPKLSFGGISKSIISLTNGIYDINWRAGDIIEFSYDASNDRFVITGGYILESMPLGYVYIATTDAHPANFFGGAWERVSYNRTFWISSSGGGNLAAQLPNITGTFSAAAYDGDDATGAFYTNSKVNCSLGTSGGSRVHRIQFNARRQNSIYTDNGVVRPYSYTVCAWERVRYEE